MNLTIKIITLFIFLLYGYLSASFPTGVVVGKVFYKKDIRELGSGNTGATNAGRVFGKKAMWIVIVVDVLKVCLPMWITVWVVQGFHLQDFVFVPYAYYVTAIGGSLGHCFPIFAQFKGGKAVSAFGAFLITSNWIIGLIGLAIFFITIKIKKHVSLGALVGSGSSAIISLLLILPSLSTIGMIPPMKSGIIYSSFLIAHVLFIYYRHHQNIVRLLTKKESRVKW